MHMGMMGHGRSPGMQDRGDADPGTEMLGIGGDGHCCLGTGLEQQAVDHALVLIRDIGDRLGQGVDEVEIADRQQLGLPLGQPVPGGAGLTLGTMPISARNGDSHYVPYGQIRVMGSWRGDAGIFL